MCEGKYELKMKVRIITSIVALAFIIPFFVFADVTTPTDPLNYLFPLLFSLIAFISVWEMLHCLKQDKNYVISVPLYLAALAFPMLARILHDDMLLLVKLGIVTALAIGVYMFIFLMMLIAAGLIVLLVMMFSPFKNVMGYQYIYYNNLS